MHSGSGLEIYAEMGKNLAFNFNSQSMDPGTGYNNFLRLLSECMPWIFASCSVYSRICFQTFSLKQSQKPALRFFSACFIDDIFHVLQ
jgi:hypothetical protein